MPKAATAPKPRTAKSAPVVEKRPTLPRSSKKKEAVDVNAPSQVRARSSRSTVAPRGAAPAARQKRPASPSFSQPQVAKKAKGVPVPTTRPSRRATASTVVSSSRSTRKPPAEITSEDGEDFDEPCPSDNEDTDQYGQDHEEDMRDEEDEQDDEDLEVLDPTSLKMTLMAERPRWAAQTDAGRDDGEDEVISHHDVEFTTASEFGGEEEVDDNLDDEGPVKQEPVASSHRARARRAEVPMWGSAEPEASDAKAVSPEPKDNSAWPLQAHYVPPPPGSRNLALTAQPAPVHALIKAAIRQVTGDALVVDAYPSPATIDDYFCQLLIGIAKDLGFLALSDRIAIDKALCDYISRLLATRLSNVRCGAKKITLPKIETSYSLEGTNQERQEMVKRFLTTGDYIYPRTGPTNNLVHRTKPFHHPMIISSIREYYFSGTRGSIATKHASRFTSSIETGPQALELEIPLPMVCTIATATYASIEDWSSGFLKKSEFNADAYEDVYRGHELFLNNIRTNRPGAYHRLMADLYKEVANTQAGHSANVVANNAMAILDLDAMEE